MRSKRSSKGSKPKRFGTAIGIFLAFCVLYSIISPSKTETSENNKMAEVSAAPVVIDTVDDTETKTTVSAPEEEVAVPLSSKVQTENPKTKNKEDELTSMEVYFIDVGQGDSTLIKCGDKTMLIDCGDENKGTTVRLFLKKHDVTHLDYLLLTHSDADHIGGAASVITNVDIDTLWMCKYEKTNDIYSNLINSIDYRNYKWATPNPGEEYELGDAKFTVIAPNKTYDNPNDSSIAVVLEHGNNRFLFAGDATTNAEEDILKNKIDISADVYKVSHHGSASSTSQKFLNAINPKYAVISCGKENEYGHPTKEVLDKLKEKKVLLFRTDEQGTISVVSDGEKLTWDKEPTTNWQEGSGTSQTYSEQVYNQNGTDTPFIVYTPEGADENMSRALPEAQEQAAPDNTITYVLNKNTMKFHKPSCSSVGDIKAKNREDVTLSREEVIAAGYVPCKRCKP